MCYAAQAQQTSPFLSGARGLERIPLESERSYFKANPNVGGMAADDNHIIINPFSKLSPAERDSVRVNEYARIFMRTHPDMKPEFNLTPEQMNAFAQYGSPDDQRQTIVARIISGDPSAGRATPHQRLWANHVSNAMGEK